MGVPKPLVSKVAAAEQLLGIMRAVGLLCCCAGLASSFSAHRLAARPAAARVMLGRASASSDLEVRAPAAPISTGVEAAHADDASAAAALGSSPASAGGTSLAAALWAFTRPHTMIGTALSIPALHAFAAPSARALLSARCAASLAAALAPAFLINVFIVGLNQIVDVEIDRVNKPALPLASGALAAPAARAVVVASLVLGLALGGVFGGAGALGALGGRGLATAPLRATLVGSVALGTAYSLPPLRLKRFPALAALCILCVRGALVNLGFFAHARAAAFGAASSGGARPLRDALALVAPRCWAATLFYVVFGVVIALMKDVPDVAGDERFGVRSLTVRLGARRAFAYSARLLVWLHAATAVALLAGVAQAVAAPLSVSAAVVAARAGVAALAAAAAHSARGRAHAVDATAPREVYEFYMWTWKLFYASYACLPFLR